MKAITFDFINLGGVRRMFAIPPSSFKSIFYNRSKNLHFLNVIKRQNIIDIYFTEDTGEFVEDEKRTPAGPSYDIEISGIIPKSNPLNQKQLIELDQGHWYVLFQDNNEMIRLAGNKDNQLRFERTGKTGQSVSNRNQIEFSFKGLQSKPCYFISLDEIDDI